MANEQLLYRIQFINNGKIISFMSVKSVLARYLDLLKLLICL